MNKDNKYLSQANLITISRIFLACLCFFLVDYVVWFCLCYIVIGLSDIIDGYLARVKKQVSSFGAKLDSLADFIFYAVMFILLLEKSRLFSDRIIVYSLIFITLFRLLNIILAKLKFNEWGIIHTYANKLTGLLLFGFIPFLIYNNQFELVSIFVLMVIAVYSVIEELLIIILSRELDLDCKGLKNKPN